MKWVWWIGGAVLFLALKSPTGQDPPGMWLVLLVILVVASLLGQSAAAKQKKAEQDARDREADEIARQAVDEYRDDKDGGQPPNQP